jgi:DNA-binding ferritin-like protein
MYKLEKERDAVAERAVELEKEHEREMVKALQREKVREKEREREFEQLKDLLMGMHELILFQTIVKNLFFFLLI